MLARFNQLSGNGNSNKKYLIKFYKKKEAAIWVKQPLILKKTNYILAKILV
jgi:hypothetical protein